MCLLQSSKVTFLRTKFYNFYNKMDTKELQITAPWGHIAVKCWGDEKNEAILVIHGILDNLGSFDRLIPLLPNSYYYICIDLPGHGRSSHWSDALPVNSLDNLLVYKIMVDYFKREKYIIMGHSWGAQIGIIFAQVYPEHVSKLIMLDAVYLFPKSTKYLQNGIRNLHHVYFATMKKLTSANPPEYTYEEALDKLIVNRNHGFLNREAAIPLLDRMAVPLPNGKIKFSVDQKVKNFNNPNFDFRYATDFLKKSPVKCPILMILANENDLQILYFRNIIKQLRSKKTVKVKFVEGNHDVHNVTPELVAPIITKFLLQTTKSKL